MSKKKNIIKFKLIKLFNSKLYSKYAEDIRKCYNLNVKNGFTNSKNIVSKTEHINWLESQKKKDANIFIAEELNKNFIGYIRSEKIKKYHIISISLNDKYKNKNIGTIILKKFLKKFETDNLSFLAIVKKTNLKSVKFFKKNDFKIINIAEIRKNELKKNYYLKLNKN